MIKFRNVTLLICFIAGCKPQPQSFDEVCMAKADSVLQLMSVDEKIGQTNLLTSDWDVTGPSIRTDYLKLIEEGNVGAIFNAYTVDYLTKVQKIAVEKTRLHIPLMFGYDVIHGHRTIFPIPLAQACTWDLNLIRQSDSVAASEANAEGLTWAFSPMLDIARDPRWGRVAEGCGEDTWYATQVAHARIEGLQGKNQEKGISMAACVKHFAAYGAPVGGRDYNTVDMSELSLYEYYLPAYKAAIDAGAATVMASFNEINGVPATANGWLLNKVLRQQWGFKGFVVSDYAGVSQLIDHGYATDSAHAGELALNAGLDMDMQGSIYLDKCKKLLIKGAISEDDLNNAVRRILYVKFKLGLFDNPYKYFDKNREKDAIMTPQALALARTMAANACVLLKNSKKYLPIPETVKTIALIGPLANSKPDMLGNWSAAGESEKCVTLLEALKSYNNGAYKVVYTEGCGINDARTNHIAEAVALAKQADYTILAVGEEANMSGEAASRSVLNIPGKQMDLIKAILALGKPNAIVLFNGRPLVLTELDSLAPALLDVWFGGTMSGAGIADVLFGAHNPSGKLTMSFPRNEGQIPIYYNAKSTGRPVNPSEPDYKYKSRYIDCANTPLYPFGFGLSYTSFDYSDITLNTNKIHVDEKITASVDITNTGNYDGEEVVQLYVRDLVGEVTRPVKELKGFRKVFIAKGTTKTITFELLASDLRYYHSNLSYSADAGNFELFVGSNSQQCKVVTFALE